MTTHPPESDADPLPARRARAGAGFSLIEVTLAIGLVAFALVAILGALPTGLQTVQDAIAQEVTASIAQQTQARLQQLSFAANSANSPTTLVNLAQSKAYYTVEGIEITDTSADPPPGAFFRANFTYANPTYPGATVNSTPAPAGFLASSQTITMTLTYPQPGSAAATGPKKFMYSFLIARQRLD